MRQEKIQRAAKAEEDRIRRESELKEHLDRRSDAGVFACKQLKEELPYPLAAGFSDVSVVYLESSKVYYVAGTVESQNALGAMLPERFNRYVVYDANRWKDITHELDAKEELDLLEEVNSQLKETLKKLKRD